MSVSARAGPAGRVRALDGDRGPLLGLGLGALVVALLAASVAVDVRAVALDETLHKLQAVRYAESFVGGLITDPFARSTARLYSFVIAPVFVVFEGETAIRVARGAGAFLFASAALPAYLLAREVLASRRLAALAGVLGVAVPWLSLATALFTENLAYPLILWATWAMIRALRDPSPRRDLVVVALVLACIGTRTQLGVLLAAYLVLVALSVRRGRPLGARGAVELVRRRFPVTALLVALGALGALAVLAVMGPDRALNRALGPYRGILEQGLPTDVSSALAVEAVALVAGVGVLPAVLAVVWAARALRRPTERAWWPVLVSVVVLAVLWLTTVLAQGGYLGEATEERYFFYAAPFLWIGALAALSAGAVSRGMLAAVTVAVALAFGLVPFDVGLNPETVFLSPVLGVLGQVGGRLGGAVEGLGTHDLVVGATLLLLAAALVAWRRPRGRWALAIAVPAVLQVAIAVYAFAATRGEVPGIEGRTGPTGERDWVQDALGDRDEATILLGGAMAGRELELNFWNGDARAVAYPGGAELAPAPFPAVFLPTSLFRVDAAGVARAPDVDSAVVQDAVSPFLQLGGRRLARSPDGKLELVDYARPAPARWSTVGLDGDTLVSRPAQLFAPGREGRRTDVVLLLAGIPNATTSVTARLGDTTREVALQPVPEPPVVRIGLSGCGPLRGELVPGTTVQVDDRQVGARLVGVEVRTGGPCTPGGR
jgi:hypothetical protein